MSRELLIISYFVVMNVIGFSSMGIDKRKARKHKWRIPEARLFLYAILGGCIGSIVGMQVFRHKTKHTKFIVGMPVVLILWLVVAGIVIYQHII